VSRFTVLLVISALVLVVAACGTDDDDPDVGAAADDAAELSGENGPADDTAGTESDDDVVESADDAAGTDDDSATESAEGEASGSQSLHLGPEPGSDQGRYHDLTLEEAHILTPFELREPADLPNGVDFINISGIGTIDREDWQQGDATTINMAYQAEGEHSVYGGLPIEFTQTVEVDLTENIQPDAAQDQITVGDREVTRARTTTGLGDEFVAYVWNEGDVHLSIASILGDGLDESDVEQMVNSIPTS
jgi:hypothetical protein